MTGRICVVASLGLASLAIGAPTASASITLGQLSASAAADCGGGTTDLVQPTVTSGNSYIAPSDGTITSWSTHGGTSGLTGSAKLKVFRKVGEPVKYRAVAQDAFRTLTGSGLQTFNVTLGGIQTGDVLGLTFATHTGCQFPVPGDAFFSRAGDLSNGQDGNFNIGPGFRTDISATFDPSHKFTVGAVTRNKKRGTATLTLTVPGPGQVTLSGNGVKGAGTLIPVAAKGDVGVPIKATGKKRTKLFDTGKVTLNVGISYTPSGGSAGTAATKVKLKKKV